VAGGGGATDADPADHAAADGTQGYHFKATGTYAALLGWGAATDGGVPDGTRQVVARALTVPVRGLAHTA
jgi:hypothetical protein